MMQKHLCIIKLKSKLQAFRMIALIKLNFDESKMDDTLHVQLVNADIEIKRMTGFNSEKELLVHALILCNRDLDLLTASQSKHS